MTRQWVNTQVFCMKFLNHCKTSYFHKKTSAEYSTAAVQLQWALMCLLWLKLSPFTVCPQDIQKTQLTRTIDNGTSSPHNHHCSAEYTCNTCIAFLTMPGKPGLLSELMWMDQALEATVIRLNVLSSSPDFWCGNCMLFLASFLFLPSLCVCLCELSWRLLMSIMMIALHLPHIRYVAQLQWFQHEKLHCWVFGISCWRATQSSVPLIKSLFTLGTYWLANKR